MSKSIYDEAQYMNLDNGADLVYGSQLLTVANVRKKNINTSPVNFFEE